MASFALLVTELRREPTENGSSRALGNEFPARAGVHWWECPGRAGRSRLVGYWRSLTAFTDAWQQKFLDRANMGHNGATPHVVGHDGGPENMVHNLAYNYPSSLHR